LEIFESINHIASTSETFKTFFKNIFNKMWIKDIIVTKLFSHNEFKTLESFFGNTIVLDTFIQDLKYNMEFINKSVNSNFHE
jgi:hypothetical protein